MTVLCGKKMFRRGAALNNGVGLGRPSSAILHAAAPFEADTAAAALAFSKGELGYYTPGNMLDCQTMPLRAVS